MEGGEAKVEGREGNGGVGRDEKWLKEEYGEKRREEERVKGERRKGGK